MVRKEGEERRGGKRGKRLKGRIKEARELGRKEVMKGRKKKRSQGVGKERKK